MADRDEKGRWLVGNSAEGAGRKSTYDDAFAERAYKLCLLGLKDEDLATAFGVHVDTIYSWKNKNPGFAEAINNGRTIADSEVAHSLYRRAVGMVTRSQRVMKGKDGNPVVQEVRTEHPPDTAAATKWLGLRQRKYWLQQGETEETQEQRRLDNMSEEELRAEIEKYRRREGESE